MVNTLIFFVSGLIMAEKVILSRYITGQVRRRKEEGGDWWW